jgi:hypothetical protein
VCEQEAEDADQVREHDPTVQKRRLPRRSARRPRDAPSPPVYRAARRTSAGWPTGDGTTGANRCCLSRAGDTLRAPCALLTRCVPYDTGGCRLSHNIGDAFRLHLFPLPDCSCMTPLGLPRCIRTDGCIRPGGSVLD